MACFNRGFPVICYTASLPSAKAPEVFTDNHRGKRTICVHAIRRHNVLFNGIVYVQTAVIAPNGQPSKAASASVGSSGEL
jgi:hypothetical protein